MDLIARLWELSPFKSEPHMILPLSDEERRYGHPTLLTNAQLDVLACSMKASGAAARHEPLYAKLRDLRGA